MSSAIEDAARRLVLANRESIRRGESLPDAYQRLHKAYGDLVEAIDTQDKIENRARWVAAAREQCECSAQYHAFQVDDDAVVSEGEDGGWVQAWVFVSREDFWG